MFVSRLRKFTPWISKPFGSSIALDPTGTRAISTQDKYRHKPPTKPLESSVSETTRLLRLEGGFSSPQGRRRSWLSGSLRSETELLLQCGILNTTYNKRLIRHYEVMDLHDIGLHRQFSLRRILPQHAERKEESPNPRYRDADVHHRSTCRTPMDQTHHGLHTRFVPG